MKKETRAHFRIAIYALLTGIFGMTSVKILMTGGSILEAVCFAIASIISFIACMEIRRKFLAEQIDPKWEIKSDD
jgi:hypothetical protein